MEIEKNAMQQPNPFQGYEPQSETFHLPSKGMFYPEFDGQRLSSVKVYDLVTQDENILLSQPLIESGEMIDVLLRKKVVSPYPVDKFTTGDRLSLLIYIRATMEQMYKVRLIDPENGVPFDYEIDLLSLNVKEMTHLPNQNGHFEFKLPKDGRIVTFKLLTGEDEKIIRQKEKKEQQLKNSTESFYKVFRLEQQIVSIEGITDVFEKAKYIRNMKIMDSRKLTTFMDECMPTIDFNIEVSAPSGNRFSVSIPFTSEFFYPNI
jgi:hypothetical protein